MADHLSDTHDQITRAVEALVTGDDWQQMLSIASRLPRYAPTNLMLVAAQHPTATQVAGYQTWRSLGRQVRAGERGIRILAPITSRRSNAADDTEPADDTPTATVRVVRGFRMVSVFDISQTDGPSLPDVLPELLTGPSPDGAWDQIAALITAVGFTVTRGWCQGANGYTDHADRIVKARDDIHPAAATRTLAHELGHVRLHPRTDNQSAIDRCRMEVEAETVAYLVMIHYGIDAGKYSFPYIARWSRGDIDRIRTTAATAIGCARQIIADLTPAVVVPVAA